MEKLKNIFQRRSLKIPVFLNTWHNKIIAREGSIFSDDLLLFAATVGKKFHSQEIFIRDTFFIKDFETLLKKDMKKYGFITENLKFLDDLTNIVAKVKIPEPILSELTWLKNNFSYNYHHIVAVTALAVRIARDYFLEEKECLEMAELGILYDIGIGHVPKEVISKVGSFDEKERNIVNFHPIYSALLIAHYYKEKDYPLIPIILNHHENLDGTGYPRGIKNNNIHSHIIKIADKFDALISARPFRRFYTTKEAFKICEEEINAGKTAPEILSIIYSYYLFVDQYPYE